MPRSKSISDNKKGAEAPIRRRTGGRSARIREAVLDAALKLISEKGLGELSVPSVAKASGVHETTIYRHWETIERLVLDSLIDKIAEDIPCPDTGSLRGDLIAVAEEAIAFYHSERGRILLKALGSVGVEAAELKRAYWEKRLAAIGPLLDRITHEFSPGRDPKAVVQAVVSPIFMRLFVTGEDIPQDLAPELVAAVLGPEVKSST